MSEGRLATNQKEKARLDSIESLRGVAALMIVFYHLVELAQLPLPPELQIIRTHFGMGVPLFYTLSGFVLAFGYADKLLLGHAEIVSFYVRRFFRIAPLFYTVLVGWRVIGWLLWSWPISSQSLFLNLTFLFGLVPGEHESLVMAGWSIGLEMLFYLLFPVLLIFLRGVRSTIVGFVFSIVLSAAASNAYTAAGLGSYAYMNLITQMPFFIAGMVCFRILRARGFSDDRYAWPVLATAILLIVLMVKDYSLYRILQDLHFGALQHNIWTLIFGLLIYAACTLNPLWLSRGALRWFGRMSFSAYLLHPIVMVVLIKAGAIVWLSHFNVWLAFLLGSTITLTLVCAVSYTSYRWIELPGIVFGKSRLSS
jgi:peptidoglycan/LPS O-acetylase OafA/YrhL